MDAIYYCCAFLLATFSLFSHDLSDVTTASLHSKLALSSCLFCVTSPQPYTYIPILRPDPGYFLSLNKYTVTGSPHNGFKDRPHRHARKIKLDTRCRLGMSVQPDSCHSGEYPCLHMLQFHGFQSPMYQTIYHICTSHSAVAHFLLPFPKVTAMSKAFGSKDVYEVYAMVDLVAVHLNIPINQLTRNLSSDAFCLVMKNADLAANTDRTLCARGSFNGLPLELQNYAIDHLLKLKPIYTLDEVDLSLKARPVPLSLYDDLLGMTRVTLPEYDVECLHDAVTYYDSTFVAPIHEDPAVKLAKLTQLYEAANTDVQDHLASSTLNDFDLTENKIKQAEQKNIHLEFELRLEEKRVTVQTLSEQLSDSAQTRASSSNEATDLQDARTEQLQQASTELTEASAALAASALLLEKFKEDNTNYKTAQRGFLVGITPLNHAAAKAKRKLSEHQSMQGRNIIHVQLKDRGYGTKLAPLRSSLVDHITTTRQLRTDLFNHGMAIDPTIGLDMFSESVYYSPCTTCSL